MTLDRASDITMNIWQVKAGDGERDYSNVFLQFGVMLMGSGEKGDYRKHKEDYDHREYRYFAEEAVKGDLVVLKRPRGTKWAAVAVGKITSGYSFEPVFSDVEDFSLQHCRQVEWKLPTRVKPVRGLGRGGGTFSHVNDERAREEVEFLWTEGKRKKSEQIPPEPEEVSPKQLADSLTAEGLPTERAKRIADEIERLQQLAEWYEDVGWYDVGEHEARTFLVVPLIKHLQPNASPSVRPRRCWCGCLSLKDASEGSNVTFAPTNAKQPVRSGCIRARRQPGPTRL